MDISENLQKAIINKDKESLWSILATIESSHKNVASMLNHLILEDWHESHEDIALTLQQLKDPSSVKSLKDAALIKFDHLVKWNNYNEFARKCIWALADIGTNEAKEALLILSENKNPEISSYAKKRIREWQNEQDRKGAF